MKRFKIKPKDSSNELLDIKIATEDYLRQMMYKIPKVDVNYLLSDNGFYISFTFYKDRDDLLNQEDFKRYLMSKFNFSKITYSTNHFGNWREDKNRYNYSFKCFYEPTIKKLAKDSRKTRDAEPARRICNCKWKYAVVEETAYRRYGGYTYVEGWSNNYDEANYIASRYNTEYPQHIIVVKCHDSKARDSRKLIQDKAIVRQYLKDSAKRKVKDVYLPLEDISESEVASLLEEIRYDDKIADELDVDSEFIEELGLAESDRRILGRINYYLASVDPTRYVEQLTTAWNSLSRAGKDYARSIIEMMC